MSRDSKFLSRVLRHDPEQVGIRLDQHGWVAIDELLRGFKKARHSLTRAKLHEIVETNDKKRFTISEDGRRIRAAQGHSLDVDLGLPAVEPPEELFHGTATPNLDSIFRDGLVPVRRRHVHLSPDRETAAKVGRRHGKVVVLRVGAGQMHAAGHVFYRSDNGVWLTDHVPAACVDFEA